MVRTAHLFIFAKKIKMELIDTHAHLYDKVYDSDRSEMLQRAKEAGVSLILIPNVDVDTIEIMLKLEIESSGLCKPMMGIHPCSIQSDYKSKLEIAGKWLEKHTFYGIGEIGLDFFWDKTFKKEQEDAFLEQCKWAKTMNLPVSIHSRNATDEAIYILERANLGIDGVFHCFSGSVEQARRIRDLGLSMGIGGVSTYKNVKIGEVIEEIGLDHFVFETDAPYLSPVPKRGKRNESAYLTFILEKISDDLKVSAVAISEAFSNNSKRIFNKCF
jgi:TatD DNase family protein